MGELAHGVGHGQSSGSEALGGVELGNYCCSMRNCFLMMVRPSALLLPDSSFFLMSVVYDFGVLM